MTKNKQSTEPAVRKIRRRTRRKFSPEEKIQIVLESLRGEQSISKRAKIKRLTMQQRRKDYLAERAA